MYIYYFLHIPVKIFNDMLIQIHQSRIMALLLDISVVYIINFFYLLI